jgi:FkbM family methyltransferase
MNYSGPLLIALRHSGRRLRILRPMVRLWRKTCRTYYEEKFDRYIILQVKNGDVIWDVGANVGFYTEKFVIAAGNFGKVIAFEPSPGSNAKLRASFGHSDNVVVERIALADFDGDADFSVSNDPTDPTNGLVMTGAQTSTIKVKVQRGESYLSSHPDLAPRCIKIDVEGFELEVLKGLGVMLMNPGLEFIFMEVHFGILAARGMPNRPREITNTLKRAGFLVRWIDPSHLVAKRLATQLRLSTRSRGRSCYVIGDNVTHCNGRPHSSEAQCSGHILG